MNFERKNISLIVEFRMLYSNKNEQLSVDRNRQSFQT